jgi:hypothetical protein
MLNYLQRWIGQLRWQRLEPFQKLAAMLLDHLEGILNYCRTRVPLGIVEAINGNIKALMRRGRGYRNLRYLLLKAQRMATLRSEFIVLAGGRRVRPTSTRMESRWLWIDRQHFFRRSRPGERR